MIRSSEKTRVRSRIFMFGFFLVVLVGVGCLICFWVLYKKKG